MRYVYMDNGATSFPKAPGVAESMSDYILNVGTTLIEELTVHLLKLKTYYETRSSYVNCSVLISLKM